MTRFLDMLRAIPWRPGIGDPSPMGWFTVAAYAVGTVTCAVAWQQSRWRATGRTQVSAAPMWFAASIVMLLLGLNKQLDLQTLLTDIGRGLARNQGWYENRRIMQLMLVLAMAGGGLILALAVLYTLRGSIARYRLLLLGIVFLTTFVLIRAASFHHVEAILDLGYNRTKLNHLLELGGISLVTLQSIIEIHRLRIGRNQIS